MKKQLTTYFCPVHNMRTVVIETVGGNGTRVLGGKCCPHQYDGIWQTFALTPQLITEMIDTLERAREEMPG